MHNFYPTFFDLAQIKKTGNRFGVLLLWLVFLISCSDNQETTADLSSVEEPQKKEYLLKKILYVDSYHPLYPSNEIRRKAFSDGLEDVNFKIRYEYMDAKNKKSDASQMAEALRIKKIFDQWQPDLVVAADDAANKYFIVPHLKGSKTPVVFNGVNWDAQVYGYPSTNITGQLEVEPITELLSELRKYAKGSRVGFLTGNTLTNRKSYKVYSEKLQVHFDKAAFVDSFAEWKSAYLKMQKEVDILLLKNYSGIENWNNEEAQEFILLNSAIPSGAFSKNTAPLALMGFLKNSEEMGQNTAEKSRRILIDQLPPVQIPIDSNFKTKRLLNMRLAQKLSIMFPVELIDSSYFVDDDHE